MGVNKLQCRGLQHHSMRCIRFAIVRYDWHQSRVLGHLGGGVTGQPEFQPVDAPALSFASDTLADDFLAPDECNFTLLHDRISWLHKALMAKASPRPGMRDMPRTFTYSEELKDCHLPAGSQSRAAALSASMEAFEGRFRPHHPHSLFNIAPSPMIDAVALAAVTSLNNPNAIWDLSCGKFSLLEQRVIRYLGELAGWSSPPDGIFTSGGKSTLMYAVKMGLNSVDPEVVEMGLRHTYTVISSAAVHFSLEAVCNFVGLGKSSCVRVGATPDGRIDPEGLRRALVDAIDDGRLVCAIVLAGGPLIDTRADPVREARRIVTDVLAEKG